MGENSGSLSFIFALFMLGALTLFVVLIVIVFIAISIDNFISNKDEKRFSRNLRIYTAVYAAEASLGNSFIDNNSIARESADWQSKKWLPTDKAIMLIEAGYKSGKITRETYKRLDFEDINIILALKS